MIQITTVIEDLGDGNIRLRSQGAGNATDLEAYYGDCIATAIHSGGEYARKQCGCVVTREVSPFQLIRRDMPDEIEEKLTEARRIRQQIAAYESRSQWDLARACSELLANIYRQLDLIRIRDGQENQPTKGKTS